MDLYLFSEIVIFGEKHAVLEPKHIQLAINGKLFTNDPCRMFKAPKLPIIKPLFRTQPLKRPILLNKRQTLVFLYSRRVLFMTVL